MAIARRLALGGDCLFLVLFLGAFVGIVFGAGFVVEVELNAVIEVRLLQHFAQCAGANLCLQRLFLVFVKIVLVVPVRVAMEWRIQFLAFDDFFFHDTIAGGERRDRRGCFGLFGVRRRGRLSWSLVLLVLLAFSAEAEEAEAARRQRIDMVRSTCVGLWLVAVGFSGGFAFMRCGKLCCERRGGLVELLLIEGLFDEFVVRRRSDLVFGGCRERRMTRDLFFDFCCLKGALRLGLRFRFGVTRAMACQRLTGEQTAAVPCDRSLDQCRGPGCGGRTRRLEGGFLFGFDRNATVSRERLSG